MTESLTPPPPSTDAKTRRKAEQDQKLANDISAAAKLIETALANPEIVELLTPRGYDEATLEEALSKKHAPAQAAFDARQVALGVLSSANQVFGDTVRQERKDYADYREIARKRFPAPADRVALGLNGAAPSDLEKFLTTATASYNAGKKAPYTAGLTQRGYTPAAIDVELQGLKAVANFAKAASIAKGAAEKALDVRDEAARELKKWVSEFRVVAKRTLRKRKDLLATLGI